MSESSSANPEQTPGLFEDRVDPSTTPNSPSQTQPPNIPTQVLQKACGSLKRNILPHYDDNEIRGELGIVWVAVNDALEHDQKRKECLADKRQFLANVTRKGEKEFIQSLRSMAKSGNWAALFDDDIFLKEKPRIHQQKASNTAAAEETERAWGHAYKGDASHVLLQTISNFLDKGRRVYSRQTNIMNSSGTGKSRMVDEISKKIIVVPMCLRPGKDQGFPPPDGNLRQWVLSMDESDQAAVRKRLHGLMYGLLTVTRITLETIESEMTGQMIDSEENVIKRQEALADAFRERMTDGQTFGVSNKYRENFYNEVIDLAKDFIEGSQEVPIKNEPPTVTQHVSGGQEGLDGAGKKLSEFVDPHCMLDRKEGSPRRPLVVFAFDEAHILTDNPANMSWNLFSELRRILRQISSHAIFSLFLSTAGRFHLFSPETRSDPSNRVRDADFPTLNPITEISFDDFAHPAKSDTVMLSRAVSVDWMCHLGRPLFGSRWDAMLESTTKQNELLLLDFAMTKLLDGRPVLDGKNHSGTLACLSVRFALEFDLSDRTADDVVRTQVERHMRLCLAATAGRDRFITLPGSEPILAEAAYQMMKDTNSNPVQHLANHSDLNCIDRGRRGELVALLLIMRAFDAARGSNRWASVDDFMKQLLPKKHYDELCGSRPIFSRGEKKTFKETFKGHGMWFNHVIKIEEKKMVSAKHLWKFITRGAMVLCATNQGGIDIVLPICETEKALSPETVTATFVQVKNDEEFGLKIKKEAFDKMNTISERMFPDGVDAKPVLRVVFALASKEAGVRFPDQPSRERHYVDKFTAFDIWIAGLSAAALNGIDKDLEAYEKLLDRSLRPHDAFILNDEKGLDETTRKVREDIRRRMAPLIMEDASHNHIH